MDTMQDGNASTNPRMTREQMIAAGLNYFGVCPECGPLFEAHSYLNVGPAHWFACDTHKTMWRAGTHLFSSWQEETEEEQRRLWVAAGRDEYRIVEPRHLPEYQAS